MVKQITRKKMLRWGWGVQGKEKDRQKEIQKVRDRAKEIETKTGRDSEKQTRGERIDRDREEKDREGDGTTQKQAAILKVETLGDPVVPPFRGKVPPSPPNLPSRSAPLGRTRLSCAALAACAGSGASLVRCCRSDTAP